MIESVEVFGYSPVICKSTFFCLTRIENPERQSKTHVRLSKLTILAFESKRTENIYIEKLLKVNIGAKMK